MKPHLRLFRNPTFTLALLACAAGCPVTLFGQANREALTAKISRLHQTPNWQFISEDWIRSIHTRATQLQGPHFTLVGAVSDAKHQAVADAFVVLRFRSNLSSFSRRRFVDGLWLDDSQDVFAVTWTDESGVFRFQNQPTPWSEPSRQVDWEICIFAPGKALTVRRFPTIDARNRIERIEIEEGQQISGTILDAEGMPCPGIPINVVEIINPCRKDGRYADIEHSFLYSEMQSQVVSDNDGGFIVAGLPANRIVTLTTNLDSRDHLPFNTKVLTSNHMELAGFPPQNHPRADFVYPFVESGFVLRSKKRFVEFEKETDQPIPRTRPAMSELRKITVRVVDAKSRTPIQGVGVTWKSGTIDNTEYLDLVSSDPPTNQHGVVEFFYPKSQDVTVAVMGRRFGYLTHYQRFTTSLQEFTPDIPQEQWLRRIERGTDNVSLTFELQPVRPTRILVLDGAENQLRLTLRFNPVQATTIKCQWSPRTPWE